MWGRGSLRKTTATKGDELHEIADMSQDDPQWPYNMIGNDFERFQTVLYGMKIIGVSPGKNVQKPNPRTRGNLIVKIKVPPTSLASGMTLLDTTVSERADEDVVNSPRRWFPSCRGIQRAASSAKEKSQVRSNERREFAGAGAASSWMWRLPCKGSGDIPCGCEQ